MGHIKEPKGVDFVIVSDPLTNKARQEISEFIKNYKSNTTNKNDNTVTKKKQRKTVHVSL